MADMHTPLKPCPFCGKEPIIVKLVEDDGYDRWHQVHCQECGIEMGEEYRSDAIAAWNRRAPSQDAETIKALRRPGTMVFLDGRNEHGSHVIPMLPTNLPHECDEDFGEVAEEIITAAEALGFAVGDVVWTEWCWNEPQTGEFGRVELAGYWEFVAVNAEATRALAGSAS